MGKYANLQADVFSIFNSVSWKAENIKTYPSNFVAINSGNEFIRVSIIPSGNSINIDSISGVIIVDIFTSAGNGPKSTVLIADKLDSYLVGKNIKITNNVAIQLFNSSLSAGTADRDNPALYRVAYSIPFTYFGAQ